MHDERVVQEIKIIVTNILFCFIVYFDSKGLSINDYLAVVAIDFGTANSGFAFSTKDRYKECPLNISLMKIKKSTDPKTSTSILLDETTRFVEFGKKAQDRYAQIQSSDKKDTYYFFENFKMMLYNSEVSLVYMRRVGNKDIHLHCVDFH